MAQCSMIGSGATGFVTMGRASPAFSAIFSGCLEDSRAPASEARLMAPAHAAIPSYAFSRSVFARALTRLGTLVVAG
jgi:hypothetical protein